jgi:hypothetical protein
MFCHQSCLLKLYTAVIIACGSTYKEVALGRIGAIILGCGGNPKGEDGLSNNCGTLCVTRCTKADATWCGAVPAVTANQAQRHLCNTWQVFELAVHCQLLTEAYQLCWRDCERIAGRTMWHHDSQAG